MFRRLAVALALFASLSFALAAKSVAPDWAAEFYPTDAQIKSACHEGYLSAPKGTQFLIPHTATKFFPDGNVKNSIGYYFPQGFAFSQCRVQGTSFRPEKAWTQQWLVLHVTGAAPDLAAASKWVAAIQVNNASGVEIARLMPDPRVTRLGEPRRWHKDCSKSPCVWIGGNFFHFDQSDAAFKAAILAGGTPRLLLRRGRGLENVAFPTDIK